MTFTNSTDKIKTFAIAMGVSAISAIALASPASAASLTECNSAKALDTYSAHYHALAKEQGKQAPGRNIRRYGLDDKTASSCKDLRESTEVLKRLRAPAPVVVISSPVSSVSSSQSQTQSNYAPSGGTNGHLQRIKRCESGGNYSARSSNGMYGGAYQFDRGTWASVGGSGDPASASPAEQDMRAQKLYNQRGGQPWPVCSQR